MFNTVIQPTGIYGTFGTPSTVAQKPAQIQTQTNVRSVLDGHEMSEPSNTAKKKNKSILPKVIAATVATVALIWGLPAIRQTAFKGDRITRPFEQVFEKPGKKFPQLDPLKKGFVKTADFLDEKVCTPVRSFLHKHVFNFKKP